MADIVHEACLKYSGSRIPFDSTGRISTTPALQLRSPHDPTVPIHAGAVPARPARGFAPTW